MADEPHHHTSLAVWSIPPTVVAGEPCTIKAGVKSSAEVNLAGCRIEACDAAGVVIASGALGSARWPGTNALHWTELSLPAPTQHGMASFSVRFDAADLAPPHRDATAAFAVMVVPAPTRTLTVRVVAEETGAPISGADIRLGAHRTTSAASGQAELRVARGHYDLHIWKVGYESPPRAVVVDGDASVEIAAATLPEESADRAWRA